MLDIKKVMHKNAVTKAIYVTEDNVKEFIEYVFPETFDINSLVIDKRIASCAYAVLPYVKYPIHNDFLLNRWYVDTGLDSWNYDEHFNHNYEFIESPETNLKTKIVLEINRLLENNTLSDDDDWDYWYGCKITLERVLGFIDNLK